MMMGLIWSKINVVVYWRDYFVLVDSCFCRNYIFFYLRDSSLPQNDKFEGFCVFLLKEKKVFFILLY